MLKITSLDGQEVIIPLELVERMTVLRDMLEDLGKHFETSVPLHVQSEPMRTILELLNKTQHDETVDEKYIRCKSDLSSMSHSQIKILANTLNFLGVEDLLTVVCMHIRELFAVMSQSEVNIFLRGNTLV